MANFCPNCGSSVEANDRFCVECGAALQPSAGPLPGSAAPEASKSRRTDRTGLVWLGAGLAAIVLAALALLYPLPGSDPEPSVARDAPVAPKIVEALKTRLVGKVYEGGDLGAEGWEDLGGGLMAEPIWFHYYRRRDGAYLVLANMALPRRPEAVRTRFRIADVLFIPSLEKGQEVSFYCRQAGQDSRRAIVAVIQPDHDNEQEWWKDVRQAWNISLDAGRLGPINPKGIECANEGWGE